MNELLLSLCSRNNNIIVLNVYAPPEDKSDGKWNRFQDEIQGVSNQFQTYHMNFFRTFECTSKEIEYIFKPIIGNEILHEISYGNGIRAGNLPHRVI